MSVSAFRRSSDISSISESDLSEIEETPPKKVAKFKTMKSRTSVHPDASISSTPSSGGRKNPTPPKKVSRSVAKEQKVAEDDNDDGEETKIALPEGHVFIGNWKGVSVKPLYGQIQASLHKYTVSYSY